MTPSRRRTEWKVRICALLLILVGAAMTSAARADLVFQPAVNYAVGSSPYRFTAGDFNGDGKPDLAVANHFSDNVSILLGDGDGTFQGAVNYGVGFNPHSVTARDFNDDGKLDLAVANQCSNNVSILLGNGDGTFTLTGNYGAGSDPYSVTASDFNRDGKQDLAVANYSGNTVSILLGIGNGTFQTALHYAVGSDSVSIATGDLNGDGTPDLAVANYSSDNVSILLGAGDGTFQSAVNYGVGSNPHSVTPGDFNGDGKLDLAAANANGNTVSILLGIGDGTFQATVNWAVGTVPVFLATGDFDGDGNLDLAVANSGDNTVSILVGMGDGAFQSAVNFATGSVPHSVTAADFNGDGKLDLGVANVEGNNVSILLNSSDLDPADGFRPALNYGAGPNPHSVSAGDFNGDGKLDLGVANYGSDNVSILLGSGDGTLQAAVNYGAGDGPISVVAGDFNGDGKLDLAVANRYSNNVSILLGSGDGSFLAAVNYAAEFSPHSVAAGDFNRDGNLDLVTANLNDNNVSVLMGNGNGTFQSAVNYGTGNNPLSVISCDFNGDGKLDLAVANRYSNRVSILLGNGNGTFQAAVNYPTGSGPYSVTAGDLNDDGKPDLAVANESGNSISILLGNGNGTFHAAVNYAAGSGPQIVATGDFDGDGKLDLSVGNYTGSNVSVLINTAIYTLSATAGPNGNISPSGTLLVYSGDDQNFSITPDACYRVADVLVDGVSQGGITSYQFDNVTADHTISASFAANYIIAASAGANGTISPSGAVGVNCGSNQSFTITPSTGYHIADVLVDGSSAEAVTNYAFTNVTTNHTISASFAINTYTVTASAGANGSISPSGAVTVNHGSNRAFIITPDAGYHVSDVLVDGSSVGSVTDYAFSNVTFDHTISASFIVTTSAATPTGTIQAGTGYAYAYSTSGSPDGGDPAEFQFDWKGDGSDLSPWGSSTQTRNWASVGIYTVRARARCALHPSAVSDWSGGLRVAVVSPKLVDFQINDGAVSTTSPSVTLTYTTTGSPSHIRISTGSAWKNWQGLPAVPSPHTISLGRANGVREVYVQLIDDQGSVSPVARASIILDTTPPKGVVKINGGNATVADGGVDGTPVRLHLAMFDANMTGAQMRIKKDTPFVSPDDDLWEDFSTGRDVTLTAGIGTRKLYVQFKDGPGKTSPIYSASIKVVPTGGLPWSGALGVTADNLQLSGGACSTYSTDTDVTLSFTLADYSGFSARYLWGKAWTPWELLTGNGMSKPLTLSSSNGSRQVYMQLREDSTGKMTDPQAAAITLDTKAPTGVIQINNGSSSVSQNTASVTLTVAANDYTSGIDMMAIYQTGEILPDPITSDDPRFEDYSPMVADYVLETSTLGTRTVYVWFKDKAGNVSAVRKDTISVVAP